VFYPDNLGGCWMDKGVIAAMVCSFMGAFACMIAAINKKK
jgi:hypothetical protein